MILYQHFGKIGHMALPARTMVKPYATGRVTIGQIVYVESEILDLQNPDAINAIKESEKRIKELQRDHERLLKEIWAQFKKQGG